MKCFPGLLLILFLSVTSVEARDFLKECPCGPDSIKGPLRLLLIQGHKGADFRSSCRKHDACYDTLGACRKSCDNAFLKNLLNKCRHSRRPQGCRRKARFTFWLVDRFGERAFESAQTIAAGKSK